MKSRQYIIVVTVLFLSVIFKNCTKNEFLPDLKGSLVGYVYTLDEFAQSLNDHSGVLITALGINEVYRVFSDMNGRFEFKNLPAGTYELHFEKAGFGTLKQFGIKHLGGEPTVLYMPFFPLDNSGAAFFIYEIPSTEITYLNIENDKVYCDCSFEKPQPEYLGLQLYFSLQDNFELESAQFIITSQLMQKMEVNYIGLMVALLPFKPGEKVYFRASVIPSQEFGITLFHGWYLYAIGSYYDYESNQTVYPALGKLSSQYSFIVPE
jgi:Carboxypeptidase regulatory-like domain